MNFPNLIKAERDALHFTLKNKIHCISHPGKKDRSYEGIFKHKRR